MVRPRQISNEQILQVARQIFLDQGPGVSTAVIAKALGVSQATLFKRFGTKAKLLQAALTPVDAFAWITKLQAGPTDAPVREQLRTLALRMIDGLDEIVPCIAALAASGHPPDRIGHNAPDSAPILIRRGMHTWLQAAVDQGRMQISDVEAASYALLSALQGLVFRRHMLKDPDLTITNERYVDAVLDMFWRGVAPVEAP